MINFTNASRVFLAVEPIDMRKSFNGLHALVAQRLREDVLGGSWFVFVNRRRTRIKILVWDGTGLWVLAKTHDTQCSHWVFTKASIPVSSAIRCRNGGFWFRRRDARSGVCASRGQEHPWDSRVDVR